MRSILFNEEFDPGSGWTLAERLTHASWTRIYLRIEESSERASNAYLTCPRVDDNYGDIANHLYALMNENSKGKDLLLKEGGASYQLVGEVIAHQDYDG